jgi:hypothetical protein
LFVSGIPSVIVLQYAKKLRRNFAAKKLRSQKKTLGLPPFVNLTETKTETRPFPRMPAALMVLLRVLALVASSGSSVAGPASAFRPAASTGLVFESRTHATSVSRGICCPLVRPVHADSGCSSAHSRPAYMREECLPLQVCRTATSPCSRATATCPSPRYDGAASSVSGPGPPPQYAPCARSSVAGH